MGGKKQLPLHSCRFNKTNKTLENLFPKGLRLGKVRRNFRELLLVSEEIGRRRCTPKGTAGYLFEKEKHLTQHYYMIHPYSRFRKYWELVAIAEMMLSLTIRSFLISQLRDEVLRSWYYQVPALICDLFELVDATVLRFLTGYLDVETRNVALETRKVFFHNIKKIRIHLNIISSLPFDFVIFASSINLEEFPILKFCIFLKILKLLNIYRYVIHISKIYNWSELTLRGVWIAIAMFILCHWLTCLFYVILFGDEFGEPDNFFDSSHNSFYRHFSIFYLIATVFFFQNGISNNLVIRSTKDMLFFILLLITVNLSNIAFMGLLIQILGLAYSSFIQYEEMIQEVQKFLIQENLPKHVHKKVIKYFEFRFRFKYFREKIILDTLSPPLRQEIANFLCAHLLDNPQSILEGIPQELIAALCLRLKFEVFLAGDVIIRAGKDAKKVYFISCGSVALYSQKNKEIAHLYKGHQFGVSALSATDNQYEFTAIALETSECYVLRHRDFVSCTGDYPECRNIVAKVASKKRIFWQRHDLNFGQATSRGERK